MTGQPSRRQRLPYNLLRLADHVLGTDTVNQRFPAARDRVHRRMAKVLQGSGRLMPVPTESDLSPQDLNDRYMRTATPVVMRGAAKDWGAVQRWTIPFFADNFGDEQVQMMHGSVTDEGQSPDAGVHRLGDILQRVLAGELVYPRFLPLVDSYPELLGDLDLPFLQARRGPRSMGQMTQLFIGAAQSDTALHKAGGSNLFVQVAGRKHWRIVPSAFTAAVGYELQRAPYFFTMLDLRDVDHQRYPLADQLEGWEVVLEPGDILYVPPFAWHAVENLDATIGIGYRWYALERILDTSITSLLLTLMSTNPPLHQAMPSRKDFAKVFAKRK